ncbi:MAG: addiction module protein [Chlorobiaceae bacterium]
MLSVSERIQLIEDIWDIIAAEVSNLLALLQAQMDELHRRVAAHRAYPSVSIPREQVRSLLFPGEPHVGSAPSRD